MNQDQMAALVGVAAALVMFVALVVLGAVWRRSVRRLRAKNQTLTHAFDGLAHVADRMPARVAERVRYAQVLGHLPSSLFLADKLKDND